MLKGSEKVLTVPVTGPEIVATAKRMLAEAAT